MRNAYTNRKRQLKNEKRARGRPCTKLPIKILLVSKKNIYGDNTGRKVYLCITILYIIGIVRYANAIRMSRVLYYSKNNALYYMYRIIIAMAIGIYIIYLRATSAADEGTVLWAHKDLES